MFMRKIRTGCSAFNANFKHLFPPKKMLRIFMTTKVKLSMATCDDIGWNNQFIIQMLLIKNTNRSILLSHIISFQTCSLL